MNGSAPEWDADGYSDLPEQEFEPAPFFAADAVERARQALVDAGDEPVGAEEVALRQRMFGNR